MSATSVLIVGLGRVVQDLLLWCTMEFGYLRLGDGFVQGSSIMPQKRNPVALEHARAIGSKAVGQAQAIVTAVHNTPFGDIVDTEDDLQPLVASMFRDATRMVTLVAAAMRHADFDVERLASRAGEGGTTLTELADTLVRDHGLPFRSGACDRRALLKAAHRGSRGRCRRALAKASPAFSARRSTTPSGAADDHEPASLRGGAHDLRRTGAGGNAPRARASRGAARPPIARLAVRAASTRLVGAAAALDRRRAASPRGR